MKLTAVIILILLISCSGQNLNKSAKYEQSHQFFIERTINEINLNSIFEKLNPNDIVIVKSIERSSTIKNPELSALIEDRILESLTKNGYSIFERNPIVIDKLFSETDSKNYYMLGNESKLKSFIKTKIPSATKIVSFRVLEFGINLKSNPADEDKVDREALVILHMRVINTQNGSVIYSKNIKSNLLDIISRDKLTAIDNLYHKPYTASYPFQKKTFYKKPVLKKFITPQHMDSLKNHHENMSWFYEPRLSWKNNGGIGFGGRLGLNNNERRLSMSLYYGAEETGFFSIAGLYDVIFKLPSQSGTMPINFYGSFGFNYIKRNKKGIALNLGGGFEYELNRKMYIQFGWNQDIAFENEDDLSSTNIFGALLIQL